ncbi:MAG: hypothetical protein M0C28_15015 [Candidatus Moduliflexus flocculans]|nr:hypothetical protein [Candidatus Moduliflexus flocculans]
MTATSFRSSAPAARRRSGSTPRPGPSCARRSPRRRKARSTTFSSASTSGRSEFDRKFDATFELQKEKHSKADELFKKALEKAEKGEDETS